MLALIRGKSGMPVSPGCGRLSLAHSVISIGQMTIDIEVLDADTQPTNSLVAASAPGASVVRQPNAFLTQVMPFPKERKARHAALFSNGRLGLNCGLEDVRKEPDCNEFFHPRDEHKSTASIVIEAVRNAYAHKDPSAPELAGLLALQARHLRSPGIDPFPKAGVTGQCTVIAGPPGIGKGAFRRRIRQYLGDVPVPHTDPSPATHFIWQLKYLEMPFPSTMKVDSLISLLLMHMDARVHGVAFKDSQRQASRSNLTKPRLFTHAGMVGLGLLYIYGLDAHKLSSRPAEECLDFLCEFAECTGVPVVCSSTYSIFGALDGSSAAAKTLANSGARRFDYMALDSDWRSLVSAFLMRHGLTVATAAEGNAFAAEKLVPANLLPVKRSILDSISWFEGRLIVEALGLPELLFTFFGFLWQVLCKKANNNSVIEAGDVEVASAQYRKGNGLLRGNLSILLNKSLCTKEEIRRFSDWVTPEQRGFEQ